MTDAHELEVDRVTLAKPPVREEWLAARAPFVGASEAAALFDEHPYLTLGDLAERKRSRTEAPENRAMIRGRKLEAAVANWYEDEYLSDAIALVEPEVLYVARPLGDKLGVLCATLDRVADDGVIVEVKTSSSYVHEIERYWYWQGQAQMLCSGLDRVDFAVLDASLDLQVFELAPNYDDQKRLLDRALDFLTYVRAGEIPPGALLSRAMVQSLYPDPEPNAIELKPYLDSSGVMRDPRSLVRALAVARRRRTETEHDVKRLEEMLINLMRGATEATIDEKLVATWNPVHSSTIDAKRLRAEHPNLAAEFTRTSTYRKLLLK